MLETKRLILKPLSNEYAEEVFSIRNDMEMMRYIRTPDTSITQTYNWIAKVTQRWDTEKIGFFAIVEKGTGTFVGWCGLTTLAETGEIELGCSIIKDVWNKGYAYEVGVCCLDYGFTSLNLNRIVAITSPQNSKIIDNIYKVGMRYVCRGKFYGIIAIKFAVERDEFLIVKNLA